MAGMNGMMYLWRRNDEGAWELARKVERESEGQSQSVAFQPDGQFLALGKLGCIKIWNIAR
jgi:hypothetical protein